MPHPWGAAPKSCQALRLENRCQKRRVIGHAVELTDFFEEAVLLPHSEDVVDDDKRHLTTLQARRELVKLEVERAGNRTRHPVLEARGPNEIFVQQTIAGDNHSGPHDPIPSE